MRKFIREVLAVTLIASMIFSMLPVKINAERDNEIVADWKFNRDGAIGNLNDGSLIIRDSSGNGNDLRMQMYSQGHPTNDVNAENWENYISFSGNGIDGEKSIEFNGNNKDSGVDFITIDGAKINSEEFRNGYTIEAIYYLPEDWTESDKWMGIIARQNKDASLPLTMDEPQLGSMSLAVSNCKEIQFLTANADDSHKMESSAWGVSMDKGGQWYHLAIVGDSEGIRTYVNGAESFRDYNSNDMMGIFADPDDGRFRIGSSWWLEGNQTLDKFLNGNLQRIRITKIPLDKRDWLIKDPEILSGDYGSNRKYELRNNDNYNFVFIPDTQNTVKFKPEVMDKGIEGLISQKEELNIAGAVHLGDVVEDGNFMEQFENANEIFSKLPLSGMNTLMMPGNHDYSEEDYYTKCFGKDSDFHKKSPVELNYSPSGRSSYMIIKGGSYDYLVIALSWYDFEMDMEWFEEVLEANSNIPTIVTSHNIVECSPTEPSSVRISKNGMNIWDIIKKHNQVFMTVSGHYHGAGHILQKNDLGNDVLMVLADYQFGYNGGNALFKYAEFNEIENKIYLSTYSPYAESLNDSERTFFDVNFLNGAGNEDVVKMNFKERFSGLKGTDLENSDSMEIKNSEVSISKWIAGEFHNHTFQSSDASERYMSLENVLNGAFREDIQSIPKEGEPSLDKGEAFGFLMTADHLRKSPRDIDGNEREIAPTWTVVRDQVNKWNELKEKGKYFGKIYYPGFEWDMFGLDHASVAILGNNPKEVPIGAYRQFEWLFSYDTPTEAFSGKEEEMYGKRQNEKANINNSWKALSWLNEKYPNSMFVVNHPSRHNGGGGEVRAEHLRKMQDIAPDVFIGFEGIPGNQMGWDRGEMKDIYGGADIMLAKVGGVWDSLLSEGRRVFTFANSDYHFKISTNRQYSSGYWPSEYSRNYVKVEGDSFSDVVKGMKSGKSFAVTGDLINALDFKVSQGANFAESGESLTANKMGNLNITIRFRESDFNNYRQITPHDSDVNNTPQVDHIDVISGELRGRVSDPSISTDETAKVISRISRDKFGEKDSEGYYNITITIPADKDRYFRLRGTNLGLSTPGETDSNGNPLIDVPNYKENYSNTENLFNANNDRNYRDLWFYSNPIFVKTENSGIINPPYPSYPDYPTHDRYEEVARDVNSTKEETNYYDSSNKNIKSNDKPEEDYFSAPNDIYGHWGALVIYDIVNNGLMDSERGLFYPDRNATRFELVKALSRMQKINLNLYRGQSLKDIPVGSDESAIVNWAVNNGIIKGYSDGEFKGDKNISREETAVILNRYVEKFRVVTTQNHHSLFKDENKISGWAKAEVKKATARELLKGRTDGNFDPQANITRAEIAQVLKNLMR